MSHSWALFRGKQMVGAGDVDRKAVYNRLATRLRNTY
jgi:hypothetical protein